MAVHRRHGSHSARGLRVVEPAPAEQLLRSERLALVLAGASGLLLAISVLLVPLEGMSWGLRWVGQGALSLLLVGGLFFLAGRDARSLCGGLWIAAGVLLIFGAPFVNTGIPALRQWWSLGLPALLALAAASAVLWHRRVLIRQVGD